LQKLKQTQKKTILAAHTVYPCYLQRNLACLTSNKHLNQWPNKYKTLLCKPTSLMATHT